MCRRWGLRVSSKLAVAFWGFGVGEEVFVEARECLGNEELHGRILERIRGAGVEFRSVRHEPARTSEESAELRGEPLRIGGKSLLLMVEEKFMLFVLSAELIVDNLRIRRKFGTRRTRFATREELLSMTGLVPGCVPPFGEPLLPFPLFVDPSVLDCDRIGFNAALLTESVIMATEDWKRLAAPFEVLPFSKPRGG